MKYLGELERVRNAMSDETKRQFIEGADTIAKCGVYCLELAKRGLMPQKWFDDLIEFGSLILLIGEGIEE